MGRGYDLPPLNFDTEELEAIIVSLNLLSRTGDDHLQAAAERVLSKIALHRPSSASLRVSDWGIEPPEEVSLGILRTAIRVERKLLIRYRDRDYDETVRVILPIVLTYFIEVATVAAWCELRGGFRHGHGDALRQRLDAEEQD
jgi:predicted DNA-binding transcriptional regulator YafY